MSVRTARWIARGAAVAALLVLGGCSALPAGGESGAADAGFVKGTLGRARAALVPARIASLTWLGSSVLSRTADGVMQHFGGISGMDWDPATGTWFLLSDDRSERAPARFYTARLGVSSHGFTSLTVESVVEMTQADGSRYPSPREGGDVPDGEALRVDPLTGELVWTSEGDRRLGLNPWVRRMSRSGEFLGELPLPKNLAVHRDLELGSRNNLSLEGLAFTPDGGTRWLAMEAPLYEDGPLPTTAHGAHVRFTRFTRFAPRQARGAHCHAQFAYPVDPVPVPGSGGRHLSDNGVSDILTLGGDGLLVIERSGHEVGDRLFEFQVRIYEARVGDATDIAGIATLNGARYTPMTKRLILDLDQAGLGRVDNIEAAAWGPRLPDGRHTLVLASDDNFAPNQVNQFLLFAVEER